jgi:DEAD/DEAH box helicase
VLVLAPTRELALQIKVECDKFGASSEIKNTVVYGGVPKNEQVRVLRLVIFHYYSHTRVFKWNFSIEVLTTLYLYFMYKIPCIYKFVRLWETLN